MATGKERKSAVCSKHLKEKFLMGTTQGVYRYEPETKSMNRFYHEFSQKNCRVLYEDSKKRVWVGTYHDGLYCIDHGKVQSYDYPDTGLSE